MTTYFDKTLPLSNDAAESVMFIKYRILSVPSMMKTFDKIFLGSQFPKKSWTTALEKAKSTLSNCGLCITMNPSTPG